MRVLLNYLWRIWLFVLAFFFTLLFFIPVFLLSIRKEHYKYAYFFVRAWSFFLFYGMGFRYELINPGSKKVQKNQPYVIIANHTSIMDIMLCALLFPNHPLCFVGKKELVNIPVFGTIYKRICVLVDRKSLKSRTEVYRRCAERMVGGDSVVIYPEGGVPDDTSVLLGDFKIGAFALASKHHFPIIALSFIGLKEMFPFEWGKGYPGKIKVILNDIIEPDKPTEELKEISYKIIKKSLEKPNVSKN